MSEVDYALFQVFESLPAELRDAVACLGPPCGFAEHGADFHSPLAPAEQGRHGLRLVYGRHLRAYDIFGHGHFQGFLLGCEIHLDRGNLSLELLEGCESAVACNDNESPFFRPAHGNGLDEPVGLDVCHEVGDVADFGTGVLRVEIHLVRA